MSVKLDAAIGVKVNETASETKYKENMKTISHIYKDTVADDKFDHNNNNDSNQKISKKQRSSSECEHHLNENAVN